MVLRQRIDAFVSLGKFLEKLASEDLEIGIANYDTPTDGDFWSRAQTILRRTQAENGWFTKENIIFALKSWSEALSEDNLKEWVSKYEIPETQPKTIAIIMAGNIPLVGFHDYLSVLITGNKVLVKLSSNDKLLLPFLSDFLIDQQSEFKNLIEFTEGRLQNFDAIIATGSNNTARYFDYYFGKYPNIIRKNRNSVAVLTGNETENDLGLLANDIFQYFGLGCRNVSKLYVPEDYDFDKFFNAVFSWKEIINNNKYINNYDYNKAVYLMDSLALLDNEFLLLKEDRGFSSPIAVLFYERYHSIQNLQKELESQSQNIQCVVSNAGVKDEFQFGKAQHPELWDYADGVDSVEFLLNLHS